MTVIFPEIKKVDITRVDIHAVDHCNFKCEGCNHFSLQKIPTFYSAEKYVEILNKLQTYCNLKEVCIMGGEPMLHPEIKNFLKKMRVGFSNKLILYTNGFWLSHYDEFLESIMILDELAISVHPELRLTEEELANIVAILEKKGLKIDIIRPHKNWGKINFFSTPSRTRICSDCYFYCLQLFHDGFLGRCPMSRVGENDCTKEFWGLIRKSFYNIMTGDIKSFRKWYNKDSDAYSCQINRPECCLYCNC